MQQPSSLHLTAVVLIHQHISVSSTTLVHVGDSLVDVVHCPSLSPGLDLVVAGKLQHLGNGCGGGTDGRSSEVDVTCHVSRLISR